MTNWVQSVSNWMLGEYRVRTTKLADNSLIQHVGIDDGSGNILPVIPVSGTITVTGVATEVTLAALNAKVTAVNTGAVTISAALPAGSNTIGKVDVNKTALTGSSPTFATVGVASAQALASNASRKGAVFTNTSDNVISFGVGQTAVLNRGVTLYPRGVWVMDEYTYSTAAINCIASVASSNLAIQEFT